ncbi:MAG: hypothetical protein KAW17_03355 [Candidatus Eisenbacteria sp.]|nr:hypothetical protein [Candidatus Eisenbacteria bacterium]
MIRSSVLLAACLLFAVLPSAAQAQFDCSDSVFAYVDGGSIRVVHMGALYNCCPTRFDYDVTVEEEQITVVEVEILENPCYCICCMDLATAIEDVPPGEYVLDFHWYEYETYEWRVWYLDVSVPDVGQMGDYFVAWSNHSDCYGTTGISDEDPPTWGMIKEMYR